MANRGRVLAELRQLLNPGSGEDLQKREVHSRLGDLSAPVVFGGLLTAALILTLVLFQDEINSLFVEKKFIETPEEMMEMGERNCITRPHTNSTILTRISTHSN